MTQFATISKYPPYISGHSHQAFWLNRELAQLLGRPQHQLSYSGPVPQWYQSDSVIVHEVAQSPVSNAKVPDGHLLKALAARAALLSTEHGVSHLLALYADPHAEVALRAARTARLAGRRLEVAVSVEGSDVTSSLARHTGDGEAAVLLADIAACDVVMAVSARARELTLDAAGKVLSAREAERLAQRIVVRYPGLPPESFVAPEASDVAQWRARYGLQPEQRLISTFVRLVPEKGIDRILDLAEAAGGRTDLVFAIAGTGPLATELAAQIRHRSLGSTVRLLGGLDQQEAHLLRAASSVALLPSRRAPDWEETFGIAAVEYQALGVPVLTSDSPGFRESCALAMFRLAQDAPARAWLARLDEILASPRTASVAAAFARNFTSRRSAETLLDAVAPLATPALAVGG